MAFKPKIPSMAQLLDVGIIVVILMVIFALFPPLRFWEKIPPLFKSTSA